MIYSQIVTTCRIYISFALYFYYTETENLLYIYIESDFETLTYQYFKTTGPIFMKLTGLIKEGINNLHINFEVNLRKLFDL